MFSPPAGLISKPPAPASSARPRGSAGPSGGSGPPNAASGEKRKSCNCRNSRCLKLYCECFASGVYCFACNCQGCHNNPENDDKRKKAIAQTLERNPQAFRPKIKQSDDQAMRHNKGCHCKKSGCLKKYCECFQAAIPCSDVCKCLDCKNRPGMPGAATGGGTAPAAAGGVPSASPLPAPKRPRNVSTGPSASTGLSANSMGTPSLASVFSGMGPPTGAPQSGTPAGNASAALPTISRVIATPRDDPISAPLQRARAAVVDSLSEGVCAGLVTDALSTTVEVPFQQQEQAILTLVHSALHRALAAARTVPQPAPSPQHPTLGPVASEQPAAAHANGSSAGDGGSAAAVVSGGASAGASGVVGADLGKACALVATESPIPVRGPHAIGQVPIPHPKEAVASGGIPGGGRWMPMDYANA